MSMSLTSAAEIRQIKAGKYATTDRGIRVLAARPT